MGLIGMLGRESRTLHSIPPCCCWGGCDGYVQFCTFIQSPTEEHKAPVEMVKSAIQARYGTYPDLGDDLFSILTLCEVSVVLPFYSYFYGPKMTQRTFKTYLNSAGEMSSTHPTAGALPVPCGLARSTAGAAHPGALGCDPHQYNAWFSVVPGVPFFSFCGRHSSHLTWSI